MKKEELEQLQFLKKEVQYLEEEIERLKENSKNLTSDIVKASSKEFPYTKHSVKIEGIDERLINTINKKIDILRQRKIKVAKLELEIEEYIDTIPDSRIRVMVQKRFIKGESWDKIGMMCHCDRTTAKRQVEKYLENH